MFEMNFATKKFVFFTNENAYQFTINNLPGYCVCWLKENYKSIYNLYFSPVKGKGKPSNVRRTEYEYLLNVQTDRRTLLENGVVTIDSLWF